MSREVFADGVLVESWDDTTRTYTNHQSDPDETRPYTAEENEAADAAAAQAEEAANEEEIGNKIETVDMPAMQAILDQTNANIRSDPSQEIKDLAKAVRRLDRKVMKLLEGTE